MAVDNYLAGSTWTAGAWNGAAGTADATANPPTVAASQANCCLFTGTVNIGTDLKIVGTVAPSLTSPTPAAADPCYAYRTAVGTDGKLTEQLTATGPSASTGTSPAAIATVAGATAGTTLTVTMARPTAVNAQGTCTQTFTRADTAASSSFVGTWQIADGVLSNSKTAAECCFLATTDNLVIASANNVVTTSKAKLGSNAACTTAGYTAGSEYAQTLEQGDTTSVAVPRLFNGDTLTLADNKITYNPLGVSGCTQTFTKVSSSAAHYMTPVAVGVAALGLVVV
jgi:endonuclease YncB( thermonuclease family)